MTIVADDISQQAADLLVETGLATVFPLPVEKVVEHLGYACHFYIPDQDVEDIAGVVSHLKKKIYVNQNSTHYQQRLCIARNIGHMVLYGFQQDYIDYVRASADPRARAAEYFAENLLMPAAMFRKKWVETKKNVNQLAEFFGVNQFAISSRVASLNLY